MADTPLSPVTMCGHTRAAVECDDVLRSRAAGASNMASTGMAQVSMQPCLARERRCNPSMRLGKGSSRVIPTFSEASSISITRRSLTGPRAKRLHNLLTVIELAITIVVPISVPQALRPEAHHKAEPSLRAVHGSWRSSSSWLSRTGLNFRCHLGLQIGRAHV